MGALRTRHRCLPVLLMAFCCGYPSAGNCRANETSIVFTQIPVATNEKIPDKRFHFRRTPRDGCRIVLLKPAKPNGELQVLTEEFHSACDPCVSFDGKKLLFAARKNPDDSWNIWEMELGGTDPRQVTFDLGDCREPVYLAKSSITPPEFDDKVRWIAFTSTAAGSYDESGDAKTTSIYTTNIEPIEGRGTVVWRNTFNLSHDFSPIALRDGRILFSSWQHHGIRYFPHGMIAFMTINWAGTGLNLFYGNHQGENVKTMACEMPDRTVVFVESDGSSYDGSGRLARVSFMRPLRSHAILSRGDGRYQTPHPLSDGNLAVSYTPGAESFGVYLFDFDGGKPGENIYDDPDWDDVDPIEVIPRDEPLGRITIVVDSKDTGTLQCLNVYDSDRPESDTIKPGDVKKVRFVEGLPLASKEASSLPEFYTRVRESNPGPLSATCFSGTRVLGEAPVEPDGSFLAELPADTPFFIQILDENGMALQTMRGWMWVRRGSRRGCIGCHENKELSPVNRTTDALYKATVASVTAPPEERRTVDFKHDIIPILEQRCMNCHGAGSSDSGPFLGANPSGDYFEAFENLLAVSHDSEHDPYLEHPIVHPGSAHKSLLIRMFFGWDDYSSAEKPVHDGLLSDEERRLFVEWIDLGARWDNSHFTNDQ